MKRIASFVREAWRSPLPAAVFVWRRLVAAYKASPVSAPVLPIEPKLEMSLSEQVSHLQKQVAALTDILRTMARQTNHNTMTIARWSKGVPMLTEIERKFYKGEQIRETRRSKKSALIVPDSTIEVVSGLVGVNGE